MDEDYTTAVSHDILKLKTEVCSNFKGSKTIGKIHVKVDNKYQLKFIKATFVMSL